MSNEKAINRAAQAKRLIEDELLVEAFSEAKRRYIEEWEKSPARDTDGRERLWTMVKLLEKVRGHLEQIMADGKIAEAEIAQIERRKRFGII